MPRDTASREPAILLRLSGALCLLVVVASGLAMAGWAWNVPTLRNPYPGSIDMKFNTAVAVSMLAIATLLGTAERRGWRCRFARLLSFTVMLFGALSLAEYALAINLGIDQLLVHEAEGAALTVHLGRPAPIAAVNCMLLGAALLLGARWWRWRQLFALIVGGDSLVGLLGYVYHVADLYTLTPAFAGMTGMALVTAILFLGLVLGILASWPAEGVAALLNSPTSGGVLARRLIPIAIIVPLAAELVSRAAQSAGVYGPEETDAVHSLLMILIMTLTVASTSYGLREADTKRRQAEENLRKSEASEEFLNLLLSLNQRAFGLSEPSLCDLALEIAVRLTNSSIGYLHFLNDDQNTISLITWNKAALEHCTAHHDSHYPLDAAGIWADAARLKQPVIHNDYQGMAGKKSYPEGHAHLIRHMSVPVIEGGKVRMIIGVGNKAGDYDDLDAMQAQILANEIQRIVSVRRSEEKLGLMAKVFEGSGEAITITDASARIIAVNGPFTKTTGYTAEEAIGKTPRLLKSGRHDAEFYGEMWRCLTTAGRWQGEIWNRRKNGEIYPEWLSISDMRDSEGRVTNYIGIFYDITDQKEAQQQIEFLAYHDGLTGLPNRQLVIDRFNPESPCRPGQREDCHAVSRSRQLQGGQRLARSFDRRCLAEECRGADERMRPRDRHHQPSWRRRVPDLVGRRSRQRRHRQGSGQDPEAN